MPSAFAELTGGERRHRSRIDTSAESGAYGGMAAQPAAHRLRIYVQERVDIIFVASEMQVGRALQVPVAFDVDAPRGRRGTSGRARSPFSDEANAKKREPW